MTNYGLQSSRIRNFQLGFEEARRQSGIVEALARRAGVRSLSSEVDSLHAFGAKIVARGEPFEDRGNWAEYRPWEFAVAQERFLLSQLADGLSGVPTISTSILSHSWLGSVARSTPFETTLITVEGDIDPNLRTSLFLEEAHKNPGYDPLAQFRHSLESTLWLLGAVGPTPILWTRHNGPVHVTALELASVVSFRRFAPESTGEMFVSEVRYTTDEEARAAWPTLIERVRRRGNEVLIRVAESVDLSVKPGAYAMRWRVG
jgi:hypothetical protein